MDGLRDSPKIARQASSGPSGIQSPAETFHGRKLSADQLDEYLPKSGPPVPPHSSKDPALRQQRATSPSYNTVSPLEAGETRSSSTNGEPYFGPSMDGHSKPLSGNLHTPEPARLRDSGVSMPATKSVPYRQRHTQISEAVHQPQMAIFSSVSNQSSDSPGTDTFLDRGHGSRDSQGGSLDNRVRTPDMYPQLQYHHQPFQEDNVARKIANRGSRGTVRSTTSDSTASSHGGEQAGHNIHHLTPSGKNIARRSAMPRPYSSASDLDMRGRLSPHKPPSPNHGRAPSIRSRHSPDSRPGSFVDLLNIPYPQPLPVHPSMDNMHLRTAVGNNASLLSTKQTMEMYRANVKKTNDPTIQYEFALFMINAAQEAGQGELGRDPQPGDASTSAIAQVELIREARQILQRLSDRSYPFAQYYLGDGYASGLFNKGKEDYDRAFPLFVSASKHGHAEAGYRAALCYEFGWGSRKDPAKAVQFYRQSASKSHPGAMTRLGKACLMGDMGLGHRYREGLKWLKRAAESADFQYNSAPYELGLLHETGFGDDVFQDDSYAAQLFTQSADLGHAEANYRLGDAYEHGKLSCPRDPGLSVHFYTGAAQQGHAIAMMALCAWYMVGAEPVLEKDENEAYEWARRSAECGFAKAQYAVGYFSEMGIGCRRDPLDANAWYVKAADQGDERAKHRISTIRAAASGETGVLPMENVKMKKGASGKEEKDCLVM
ncbi:MAG: hypothetical protein M1835_004122 [Candelina submexicana]|nr:MAG: hypothetical protein M1835_004122 [Candelina submexicana]